MSGPVATIAVILPVHNRKDVTLNCLNTLYSFRCDKYRLFYVLVDDGSTDGTGNAVNKYFPDVKVLKGDGNLWWAGGVNKGFEYVKNYLSCDFVLLMNDDSTFKQSTLDVLIDYISDKNNVCASSIAIIGETNKIYCAGHAMNGRFSNCLPLYQGCVMNNSIPKVIKCDSLSSRFVLMPFDIISKIGLFDNKNFPHAYSDIEYFLRAKSRGYSNVVLSESVVKTSINTNYMRYSFVNMDRTQYIKSFFSHKYGNNFKTMVMSSIMHRETMDGALLLANNILSTIKMLAIKLMLPSCFSGKLIDR